MVVVEVKVEVVVAVAMVVVVVTVNHLIILVVVVICYCCDIRKCSISGGVRNKNFESTGKLYWRLLGGSCGGGKTAAQEDVGVYGNTDRCIIFVEAVMIAQIYLW